MPHNMMAATQESHDTDGGGGSDKPVPRIPGVDIDLLAYIEADDLHGLREALASGADPNDRGALRTSAMQGRLSMMEALLAHGADPDVYSDEVRSPLLYETILKRQGQQTLCVKTVQLLLRHRANPDCVAPNGIRPLHLAAYLGLSAVVKALIEAGADVNAPDMYGGEPVWYAMRMTGQPKGGPVEQRRECLEAMIAAGAELGSRDWAGTPLLHRLLDNNHLVFIQTLLENGIDINMTDGSGNNILHAVCNSQNFSGRRDGESARNECMDAFIGQPGIALDHVNNSGHTPLDEAARRGQLPLVALLLDAGASPNVGKDDAARALYNRHAAVHEDDMAFWSGRRPLLEAMLEKGLNVDRQDPATGNTLLHQFCMGGAGKQDIACLLDAQADINLENRQGQTPLACLLAASAGLDVPDMSVLHALLDAGAEPVRDAPANLSDAEVRMLAQAGALAAETQPHEQPNTTTTGGPSWPNP